MFDAVTSKKDYHDYVIKDGQFIGEFEQMYVDCSDPWHQLKMESHAYTILLDELKRRRWGRVLDVGCGLGTFTAEAQRVLKCAMVGVDVSPTACRHAKERFGNKRVIWLSADSSALPFSPSSFDGAIISELLWYVLLTITDVLAELRRVLRPCGELWILQQFYQPGEQRYGNEIMQTPEDCIEIVRRSGFAIKRTFELDRLTNHKLILFSQRGNT